MKFQEIVTKIQKKYKTCCGSKRYKTTLTEIARTLNSFIKYITRNIDNKKSGY